VSLFVIQRWVRVQLFRRRLRNALISLRQEVKIRTCAAIVIQSAVRTWLVLKQLAHQQRSAIIIQVNLVNDVDYVFDLSH
jgi:IQ calmodulin-binding motif